MLKVQLLGSVQFVFDGKPVEISNKRARAALGYLCLTDNGAESRALIAGLLWSNADRPHGLASLRDTVKDLRRAFENVHCPLLTVTGTQLALDRSAVLSDVDVLARAVEIGQVPPALLYQPHLPDTLMQDLAELDEAFSEWLAWQRHALQRRLLQLLQADIASHDLPVARRRQSAQAVLLLDPTDEEACRVVMRAAAETGDTAAALRSYDTLYRSLDADHDMEPSQATQALLARIKLGEFDTSPRAAAPLAGAGPPRVAVMPFRTMGAQPIPDYLADGLAEDIVCMLAAVREPVVISSNSTRCLRDRELDLAGVGRLLDVHYVVSGLLRRMGQRLRISVELAEAATGAILSKQNYDTDEDRVFEVHDTIVANVVNLLAPRVSQAELRRIRPGRPDDLGAYHRMLQARELIFALDPGTFAQAGTLLHEAIALDPGYASTHVTLSDWCSLRLGQGWSPDPAADSRLLDKAARTALRHDPDNGPAMARLGHNRTLLDQDYAEALGLFERALAVAPNDATVLAMSSPTFAFMGEPAEAIRRAEHALRLSPQDMFAFRLHHFLSIGHFFADDLDSAEHWGRKSLDANPNYTSNVRLLAGILAVQGRREEAAALGARAMALQPGFRVSRAMQRYAARDPERRRFYGAALLAAGLPA